MRKFSYLGNSEKPESPSVVKVHRYVTPVATDVSCLTALEMFFNNHELYALPVTNAGGVPVALVERQSFIEFFGQPFTREVHGKKTILEFLANKLIMGNVPITVDVSTSTDDVAQIIIDKGMQHMVSGFIVTEDGRYVGVANGHNLLDEITRRKQAELYYLAHYDQLTGVPNRMLFSDRLTQACREAARKNMLVGLMFVDLDRFKQVNDSLGHSVGDHLLRSVVDRLKGSVRDCDTVARLGGDEFAILLDELKDVVDAEITARRVIASLQHPFTIMGHELFVTASLGIAVYPKDDSDIGRLLTKADAAMYEAKRSGRNAYRTYTSGLSIYSLDHLSLETDLRSAVENDEFVLFYQPQVNLATGQVVGVEALVRWQHPQRGLLSPAQFIGLAEESGLIVPIGNWVLRKACQQVRAWSDAGLPPLRMAVNVSSLQFQQVNFCSTVKAIINESGVDPDYIELELTESIVMHHGTLVLDTLRELKQIGVMLAIDDFGTGFSSLSYLRRFPIDCLKIDQSFIRDIESMPVNEAIVRAIIALAQSLSLEVVAEGIETESELAVLKTCHCPQAQGYHYLRPLPADDFMTWLFDYRGMPVQSTSLL
jgi:diguanylate cyclase (GGDEF)-like protein